MFVPEGGNWLWARVRKDVFMAGLGKLTTGETALVTVDSKFDNKWHLPLAARPEQCKALASAVTDDGVLYWLSTGPNRLLHLNTPDNAIFDLASFGKKIYGAAIFPSGKNLKLVVIFDKEVRCYTIDLQRLSAPTPIAETIKSDRS